MVDRAGFGLTVNWPAVQGGVGATGNPGMVSASKTTPYSIAYIGISFKTATDAAGLGEAMLQNKDGNFVLPTRPRSAPPLPRWPRRPRRMNASA